MGAIQNSLNQALGTVAAAGIGIKHVKEQEAANAISAQRESIIASEQAKEAEAKFSEAEKAWSVDVGPAGSDFEGLTAKEQYPLVKGDLEKAQKDYDDVVKQYNDSKPGLDRMTSTLALETASNDLNAARSAFEALETKRKAFTDLQERAAKRRQLADTLTSIAESKSEKYSRKWGGIK